MYAKLLSMTWGEVMQSDYIFKSNTEKRVIQIFGKEFVKGDTSLILVYYNVYYNTPMLLIQRYDKVGLSLDLPKIKGFNKHCTEDVDTDGTHYTEVVYISEDLQKSLED